MRSSSKPSVLRSEAVAGVARWAPGDLASHSWNGVPMTREEAERAREQAEREAHDRGRTELEAQLHAARAAGFEEGFRQGACAEAERLRTAVVATEQALDTIRENEVAWQDSVSDNISALAVAVARHLMGRELQADPTAVADLVKRALAEFPIDQPMRVRVHPQDLSLLSLPTPEGGDPIAIAPNRDVRWLADSRIQPGGCMVEGRDRIIDGRVDTALERVYRRLTSKDA